MTANKITHKLTKLVKSVGIDRAIAYTILGKGFQIVSGPVTLLLIAHYLSPSEQGFYYTFSSIVGLQLFFELGLSFVILQFASHEKAALTWSNSRTLEGDEIAKARLASLLRLTIKWYAIIAILAIVILIPVGISFFNSNKLDINVPWQLPWILVVFSSGTMLFITPLVSFLEGCGLVAEIAYVRVAQGLISNFCIWLAVILNTHLFAAAIPNLVGIACLSSWLYRKYRYLFIDLLSHKKPLVESVDGAQGISWRREIFPLQWRIALSALSGYFVFSLFTPTLFKFHGPVIAGQMGMSLTLTNTINSFAMSWLSTKLSPFGSLIAAKKYAELDKVFFRALLQAISVAILGSIILLSGVFYLQQIDHPFHLRVVSISSLTLLLISSVCNVYIFGLAIYLRSHKKEPFLALSIVIGIITGLLTYFLGRQHGIIGMSSGYCLTTIISVICGSWIFVNKRREWHVVE